MGHRGSWVLSSSLPDFQLFIFFTSFYSRANSDILTPRGCYFQWKNHIAYILRIAAINDGINFIIFFRITLKFRTPSHRILVTQLTLSYLMHRSNRTSGISLTVGGSAVRALDTRPKGPRFNVQPMRYEVTVLGKLFAPTCLCRCKCLVVSVDS